MSSKQMVPCVGAVGALLISVASCSAAEGDRLDRSMLGRMTFSEEFDGPLSWCSEDCQGQRWRTKYFHSGTSPMSRGVGVNESESEVFMDPKYLGLGINPFSISDGILDIAVRPASAKTQAAVNAAWPASWGGPKGTARFTAGMLSTEKSFQQRYGYFEARAKVPALMGGWPAFWLLGPMGTYDEIDVFEVLTGQPAVHYGGYQWGKAGSPEKRDRFAVNAADLSKDFHVYGVLWTPDVIVYYRDDTEIARLANQGLHLPLYLIISIGTDGDWNRKKGFFAPPDASGDLLVDYIRAYQIAGSGSDINPAK
jgi:beta-glucanase (GH16 family)